MIIVKKLSESNRNEFIALVEQSLTKLFNCDKDQLPENYSQSWRWGLLNLLTTDIMSDYYLLLQNGQVWAGAGGIVRFFNEEKIYQAGFRGFSCAKFMHSGLGMKSLLHHWITREQISYARSLNCTALIISFNEHNRRLFEITHKYIMPRSLPEIKWEVAKNLTDFNRVPQWLMIHRL